VARDEVQMAIARAAARLFLERGVAATGGEDIARAVGISTRTVWRHFRNKESCVAPLLAVSIKRFVRVMRLWSLDRSLEDHLRVALPLDWETAETIADGGLAVRLIVLASQEPDIRTMWLDAYHQLENALRPIIGERCNRAPTDFDVRLCAATIGAAIRIVDESISVAAVKGERSFDPADLVEILAGAIRDAATLPICDPVSVETFGARSRSQRTGN
jgi:AcrR family transcriptional regulator